MDNTREAFAANIQLRKAAEALIELAGDQPPRYWEELAKAAHAKIPQKAEVKRGRPMGDIEAKAFEDERLTFGIHKGKRISEAPADYLCWLVDEKDFKQKLVRYLSSELFRRRQEAED